MSLGWNVPLIFYHAPELIYILLWARVVTMTLRDGALSPIVRSRGRGMHPGRRVA